MSWNHRVVKHMEDSSPWFAIHEIYYDPDGKIDTWTDPIEPYGEDQAELWKDLIQFCGAFDRPTLTMTRDEKGEEWLA